MKIILTGALGHIGKPLTEELLRNKHEVTVISSKQEREKEIHDLGGIAAIGSLEDAAFLAKTFKGADAVYLMVPPNFHGETDPIGHYRRIGANYVQAIKQSGVRRIVHLSSYGADLEKGTGPILGSHHLETLLNEIPDIDVTHMRPTYFFYNVNAFIGMIKNAGMIAVNYGNDPVIMVAPADIAAAIAEEIVTPLSGRKIRYVASDSLTGSEIAGVLGNAIGKPDLAWVVISDEVMRAGLEGNGFPSHLAGEFVDMFASLRKGELAGDYVKHAPAVLGSTKFTTYATEFAELYNKS